MFERQIDYNWDDDINTQPAVTFQVSTGNSYGASSILQVNDNDLQNFYIVLDDVCLH